MIPLIVLRIEIAPGGELQSTQSLDERGPHICSIR